MPVFFHGLRESEEPYKFLAEEGCEQLIAQGQERLLPALPLLIQPIKLAFDTRSPEVICKVLKTLQQLVKAHELVGPALVPFFRQLLPVFNVFKLKNVNIGDQMYFAQRKRVNLGDLIQETLELLELRGGEDAYINIKYMVPTYESCLF